MLGVIPCTRLGYLCALCSLRVSNTLRVLFAPPLGYALLHGHSRANKMRKLSQKVILGHLNIHLGHCFQQDTRVNTTSVG